jgi:hypothetical protein
MGHDGDQLTVKSRQLAAQLLRLAAKWMLSQSVFYIGSSRHSAVTRSVRGLRTSDIVASGC